MTLRPLTPFRLPLSVDAVELEIDGVYRAGSGTPLVFLHGFGSTKEDYADVVHQHDLDDHPVIAYDAPGCGATASSAPGRTTVELLVEVAERVLAHVGVDRFHLVGHSMGGLTALRLATRFPGRTAGFVNIEGNLAPEDCFLSRQIVSHRADDPGEFLALFAERLRTSRFRSSSLYASSLPYKVRAEAVEPIFRTMVEHSDGLPLLDDFLALPAPRMLMYGEQNSGLSYLPELAANGVELAAVPRCGHFPMYANPTAMWDRISAFLTAAER
ncbi:MAG: alpha/beta hydrolase [Pseudonocardia sediminis]